MFQLLQHVPCADTRRANGASAYSLGPLSLRAAREEVSNPPAGDSKTQRWEARYNVVPELFSGLLERAVYSK